MFPQQFNNFMRRATMQPGHDSARFSGITQYEGARHPRLIAKIIDDPDQEGRGWLFHDHPALAEIYAYDNGTQSYTNRLGQAKVFDRLGCTFAVEQDFVWVHNMFGEWQVYEEFSLRLLPAKALANVATGAAGQYRITVDEITGVRSSFTIDVTAVNINPSSHSTNDKVVLFLDRQGISDWLRASPTPWPDAPVRPGRFCAMTLHGGGGGSPTDLKWVLAAEPVMPFGRGDGTLMDWVAGVLVDTEVPVTFGDPEGLNCVLMGESVLTYYSAEYGGYVIIGSCGLRRYARADDPIIPGQDDYDGPPPFVYRNTGMATLLDWSTAVDSWQYAQNMVTSSFQIEVFDPSLQNVVLPDEIVPVFFDRKFSGPERNRWLIEGSNGTTRRAKLTKNRVSTNMQYLDINQRGQFTLAKQDSPYEVTLGQPWQVSAVSRLPHAIRMSSWVTLQWVPGEGYRGTVNHRPGNWIVVESDARLMRVKLEQYSPGALAYRIRDPESQRMLDAGPVDPSNVPHDWKRDPEVDYEPATYGYALFTGIYNAAPDQPQPGQYLIGWCNERPKSTNCPTTP